MTAPADPIARARLAVARFTGDAEECRAVLDMLGLLPDQVECAGTCDTCGRRMIHKRHPGPPPKGWARREGPGRCIGCYHAARRATEVRGPRRHTLDNPHPQRADSPRFQADVRHLHGQGLGWAQIGARLGCDWRTARKAYERVTAAEGRTPARRTAHCTDPRFQARVLAMMDDGMTINETAARLGCHWGTVRRAHDYARPETPWTSQDRTPQP